MTTTATPAASTSAYGLRRPTVLDARSAIERVYGAAEADAVWSRLAGPALGNARTALTVEEIVGAMLGSDDDVVRLCGQSLMIRLRAHTHLAAASDAIS